MLKELLKIVAAGLAAAAVQFADAIASGSVVIDGKFVLRVLAGTVLVRLAQWVVGKYGPEA